MRVQILGRGLLLPQAPGGAALQIALSEIRQKAPSSSEKKKKEKEEKV